MGLRSFEEDVVTCMSSPFALQLNCVKPLPSPREVHTIQPASEVQHQLIQNSREAIIRILERKDPRLLLVVGPCSIHDITAAKQFATHLKQLSEQVSDRFLLVMRVHCEKPRTCRGWKGLLYDPSLDDTDDLKEGIRSSRQLLLDLAEMGVPTSTEFLDPISPHYLGDLISWAQIGARTSASQIHRQMVSSLAMPIGFKNSTDGDITTAINGVLAAGDSQSFLGVTEEGHVAAITSKGNPHCHIVLRGGMHGPNYSPESIRGALHLLREANLPPHVMIDCSHDNCGRDHRKQKAAFQSVLTQLTEGEEGIMGVVLESHLEEGQQRMETPVLPSLSLTDPCLSWEETEELILAAHEQLNAALVL